MEQILYITYLPTDNKMIVLTNQKINNKTKFEYLCDYKTFCKKNLLFLTYKEKYIKEMLRVSIL